MTPPGPLIVVGFTTAFWVLALMLVSYAVGIAICSPIVIYFGLLVAAFSFVCASIVMAGSQ